MGGVGVSRRTECRGAETAGLHPVEHGDDHEAVLAYDQVVLQVCPRPQSRPGGHNQEDDCLCRTNLGLGGCRRAHDRYCELSVAIEHHRGQSIGWWARAGRLPVVRVSWEQIPCLTQLKRPFAADGPFGSSGHRGTWQSAEELTRPAGVGLEQTEASSFGDRRRPRSATELVTNVRHVAVHRVRAHDQLLGNLAIAETVRDEL